MKITRVLGCAFCCLLASLGSSAKAYLNMDSISNKQRVLLFYKLIVGQRKAELIPEFVIEDYKQHNPTVKQGRGGITEMINYMKTLLPPPQDAKSPVIRAIQEGDFVVTHLDVQFMGKHMAVIDLFKLKDGMLAEHWDAIQSLPDESGMAVTATNGTSAIDHAVLSENSKMIVSRFYDAVINNRPAAQFIDNDYIEHDHATLQSGKKLAGYIAGKHDVKLHRMIAEGDFVVVQSQFGPLDKAFVLYEIFRVADSKIVEHWSVEQVTPEGVKPGDMF